MFLILFHLILIFEVFSTFVKLSVGRNYVGGRVGPSDVENLTVTFDVTLQVNDPCDKPSSR